MAKRNTILALGAAVLVLAFWKLRLTDPATEYTLGSSDFYLQLYPMWARAGVWMRAGVLPLWNPYQMGGHPFLASLLYGVLYPPNLVRLILSDTFYPGWEAEVDGEPAAIHRANYLFRGVYLTAGPHRVSFVYRPRSLQIGALLSLVACAVITLMPLGGPGLPGVGRWPRRRRGCPRR